jgi:hypothetical protein
MRQDAMYFFSLSFLIELVTSIKHSINFSTTELYTANIYSNGKAFEKYNIPRHKVAILSECFAYVGDKPRMQNPLEVKLLLARKHEKALHKLIIGPGDQGK